MSTQLVRGLHEARTDSTHTATSSGGAPVLCLSLGLLPIGCSGRKHMDIAYVALTFVLLALSYGLVRLCDRV
jgi:hypothetical protein